MVNKRKRVSLRPKREAVAADEPKEATERSGVYNGTLTSISLDPVITGPDVTVMSSISTSEAMRNFSLSLQALSRAAGSTARDTELRSHTQDEVEDLLRTYLLQQTAEVSSMTVETGSMAAYSFDSREHRAYTGGQEHTISFLSQGSANAFRNKAGATAAAAFMRSCNAAARIAEHLTGSTTVLLMDQVLICTPLETYFVLEVEAPPGRLLSIYDATGASVRHMRSGGHSSLLSRALTALGSIL